MKNWEVIIMSIFTKIIHNDDRITEAKTYYLHNRNGRSFSLFDEKTELLVEKGILNDKEWFLLYLIFNRQNYNSLTKLAKKTNSSKENTKKRLYKLMRLKLVSAFYNEYALNFFIKRSFIRVVDLLNKLPKEQIKAVKEQIETEYKGVNIMPEIMNATGENDIFNIYIKNEEKNEKTI
jgi:hypothetical protein